MNFLKQIFEDNSGGFSMQRTGTAVCLIVFIIVAIVILIIALTLQPVVIGQSVVPADTKVIDSLVYFALGILAFGLGVKAVQRFGEKESQVQDKMEGKI